MTGFFRAWGSAYDRRARRLLSGEAGFSLVELVVTIAVIGIVAAIAVPSFKGLMPKIRLNNDAMTLSNEVALSRVRAIAKSIKFRISFDTTAHSYAIKRERGAAFETIATNTLKGSKFVDVTGFIDADEVTADTNGAMTVAYGSEGLITLKTPDGSIQKRIVVEPVGRVTVRKSVDGGSTWQAD